MKKRMIVRVAAVRRLLVMSLFCWPIGGGVWAAMPESLEVAVDFAEGQARAMLAELGYGAEGVNPDWSENPAVFPKVTESATGDVEWSYKTAGANWGAGFTPGLFWDLHELTGDGYWETKALEWTEGVRGLTSAGGDMRMNLGFHFMNSFARKLAHGGEAGDAGVMAAAADTLKLSWMPEVGSFYSFTWSRGFRYDGLQGGFSSQANAIIDSAPNMELALYEAKRAGDADLWAKGISHLENLWRDNIREDGSTGQLAAYDTETGEFLGWRGHQGYGPETTWSRGQGWALHGMATAWRETADDRFGDVFHELYSYYRDNAPADGVPYWDFAAPLLTPEDLAFRYPSHSNLEAIVLSRDSSAAALAASGLLEAVVLAETDALAAEYFGYAERILLTLSEPGFLAMDAEGNAERKSILRRGSYTFPGVDKGQSWGDFYYVEALRRYRDLVEGETVFGAGAAGDLANYRSLEGQRHWRVKRAAGDWVLWGIAGAEEAGEPSLAEALWFREQVDGLDVTLEVKPEDRPEENGEVEFVLFFDYTGGGESRYFRVSAAAGQSGVYELGEAGESRLWSVAPPATADGRVAFRLERDGTGIRISDGGGSVLLDEALAGTAGGFYWGFGVVNGAAGIHLGTTVLEGGELVEQPFESWRSQEMAGVRFPLNLPGADADGDGRSNWEEYVTGGDSMGVDGTGIQLDLRPGGSSGAGELVWEWDPGRTDVRYHVERSRGGLHAWAPMTERRPSGGHGETEEVVEPVELEGGTFYRLRMERGLAR